MLTVIRGKDVLFVSGYKDIHMGDYFTFSPDVADRDAMWFRADSEPTKQSLGFTMRTEIVTRYRVMACHRRAQRAHLRELENNGKET